VSENQDKFESWGLLELFGHQRLAGRLTEQTIGGCHFIRLDVPEVNGVQGYTRFFTNAALTGAEGVGLNELLCTIRMTEQWQKRSVRFAERSPQQYRTGNEWAGS
jgi:hypothetical protein